MLRIFAAKSFVIATLGWSVALAASSPANAPSEEAKGYLDRAITLLQEKHINSQSADWPTLRANAYAQITNAKKASDIYPAIQGILDALNEKHSFLVPRGSSIPVPSPNAAKTAVAAETIPMPHGHIMSKRVGYVWLPELNAMGTTGPAAGASYRQNLISLLKALDKRARCGWIIDLRDNSGGNMWPMLNGLDPLLGIQPFGFFVGKGENAVPWARTEYGIGPTAISGTAAKPSFELKHADTPVAVLIGPQTSSTGEMIALAFIGRAKTKTFGSPTYGFTTANTVQSLSDGAMLVITESRVRDRTGKDYFGAIVPDELVSVETSEKSAADWIKSQCK